MRGVLADRRDASRVDYERPGSAYEFGGCVVNMDTPAAEALALKNVVKVNHSESTSTVMATATSGSKNSKRTNGTSTDSGKVATEKDVLRAAGTIPPKMDRVNVRRTTRWIACLAQVIKLVQEMERGDVRQEDTKDHETSNSESEDHASAVVCAKDAEKDDNRNDASVEQEASDASVEQEASESHEKMKTTTAVSDVNGKEDSCDDKKDSDSSDKPIHESASEPNANAEAREPDATDDKNVQDQTPLPDQATVQADEGSANPPPLTTVSSTRVTRLAASDTTPASRLPPLALAYLEEATNVVRPFDPYALRKIERAHDMLERRNGPGLSLLHALIQEYTRFMYIKHTRAGEKAAAERRRQEELEAQAERERVRKRQDREAELALKKQMLAMRKRQRQQLKKESGQ
ncbi:hypothetical protein PINS_up018743 [Pythium insidiosum]|nr:hypothetical protein PINS_up018743 [Pythium insidiosum]